MPNNINHSHHSEEEKTVCSKRTYQSATLSVPVTVKPIANAGEPSIFCCGEPKVIPSLCTIKCNENISSSCKYIVSQDICIEVPIEFSASVCVGSPCVECKSVSGEDICMDCKDCSE